MQPAMSYPCILDSFLCLGFLCLGAAALQTSCPGLMSLQKLHAKGDHDAMPVSHRHDASVSVHVIEVRDHARVQAKKKQCMQQ